MISATISSVFMLLVSGFALVGLSKYGYEQLLNTPAGELIEGITESIVEIYKFFYVVFDFFTGMLDVFPSPFATLLKSFLLIMFAIFIWKLVKAGG